MLIYNVTINVDDSVHSEWLHWMKQEHIPEMLDLGIFDQARFCKVLVQEEMGGTTYAVQYQTESQEKLDLYYKEHAERLRQTGLQRFGEKCVSFRTELEIISDH